MQIRKMFMFKNTNSSVQCNLPVISIRIRLIRENLIFRRYVKANQNFKTTGRETSNNSGLRNDVRAIQNLITIGRQIKPTSLYNNSPKKNIIKPTCNY